MTDPPEDKDLCCAVGTPLRALVASAAIVVVLAAIHWAAALVVPLVIAVLIAVVAGPYEQRLIERGWPRLAAFGVVLAATVAGLIVVVIAVDVSLSAFIADLPAYQPGSERLLNSILGVGTKVGIDLSHLVHAGTAIRNAFSTADALTRSLLASLAGWTIVLLLTVFMLYEALDFPEKLEAVLGHSRHRQRLAEFAEGLSRFMSVTTIGAAATGIG
ncbi:MAG: AI-2E family transporter, partial [Coriobacteriia bacterium]|nr:AI-2E family transporter [Coriobacteriia bacterium]